MAGREIFCEYFRTFELGSFLWRRKARNIDCYLLIHHIILIGWSSYQHESASRFLPQRKHLVLELQDWYVARRQVQASLDSHPHPSILETLSIPAAVTPFLGTIKIFSNGGDWLSFQAIGLSRPPRRISKICSGEEDIMSGCFKVLSNCIWI